MMAKPMKTLELHYPIIQFLINANIPIFLVQDTEGTSGSTRQDWILDCGSGPHTQSIKCEKVQAMYGKGLLF